ncbi:MAG: M20 family metallopeptidase [Candidatus Helarchaeota archaeon]
MSDVIESVKREIANLDNDTIVKLFNELLSIDTSNPPGHNYAEFAAVLEPHFHELGFKTQRVIVPDEIVQKHPLHLEGPRVNLVASKEIGIGKSITFYAHSDVVPVGDLDKWTVPPFGATKKGRKIIGRGTSDMKGALASLLLALQVMKKLNLESKHDIHVVACTDEEVGITPGVEYLYEQGHVKGDIWCMEGVNEPLSIIGTAGTIDFYITTRGKSCHSGTNFLGVNALEESVPILTELLKLKREVEKRESKTIPGPPMPGAPSKMLIPMFNIDMIRAGIKSNIVPEECRIVINRRYLPSENEEDVIKEIVDAVERGFKQSKLINYSIAHHVLFHPFIVDPESEPIQKITRIMTFTKGKEPRKIGLSISTDMGPLCKHWNRRDIIFRGIGNVASNAHGENESVLIADVRNFILEIICYVCDLL